jgi:1-acyl-sn-glycerol-3-phosphate acyltransferase
MIDNAYLENIKLVSVPKAQVFIASFLLFPNYNVFAKVDIQIEGLENIPKDKNVIFAMNHTDRFNYWPFQYKLWTMRDYPFTTVWVKGKYYRNFLLAKGLDWCQMIPVPSMKYLIQEIFKKRFGRRIGKEEYRIIKNVIDGMNNADKELMGKRPELDVFIKEKFVEFIKSSHETILEKVGELSKTALVEKNLNLIIFPEGTRSTKLGEGKTGLAQLSINTETPIIPVGCNNSDQVYVSEKLPIARNGEIVYRVGDPLSFDGQLKSYRIKEGFTLFSAESKTKYKEHFEEVTKIVMERINELVDDRYKK